MSVVGSSLRTVSPLALASWLGLQNQARFPPFFLSEWVLSLIIELLVTAKTRVPLLHPWGRPAITVIAGP